MSKKEVQVNLKSIEMLLPGDMRPADASNIINKANSLADGVELTRDLGNLPPNICTPSYLANTSKALSKQFRMKCEILDKSNLEKLGMGSFL